MKFLNVNEEITKYQIGNDTFFKVLSYDKTTSAVNVNIFYKSNNRYRSISQSELPKDIVNFIASKKSEPISKEELNDFENFFNNIKLNEFNTNIENVQTIFGKCLHTDYILTKDKTQDYYCVQQAITNEFGVLVSTTPIISSIVPYIFADIINIGNTFKKQLFLIDKNIFVQMCQVENTNLGIIYQFEEKENEEKASITIIGIFGIEKDFKGFSKILVTQEDLNKIKNIQDILDEQTNLFIKKLSLQKIN